ncbi:Ig-like domain-containing protein [Acinetobacter baumannii]|uniref:Ig-like domain-containing protein n=1 Tax=Acinetobacter baumannii TaxID=470 RepID=UPI0003F20792|nr:Ig-like domain-containing protein [Acinetobacter baumannii]AHJ93401.1 RTX toxin [Acinetobacter baumannii PKAB07]
MQNILTFIKNGQKFTLDASNIKSVRDTGNGFEITLKSGEIIQAESYSVTPNTQPVEQVSSQQVENNSEADEEFEKEEVLKEKSLLDSQTMLWGGAAIALGGIAIAASGSGGSDGSAPSDQTPPASLTKILSKDGKAVSGLTEAGATVIVENSAGKVIGSAKAGADGTYLINLDKAYINGEILKVSAQDTAGNSTVKQELIASDITAPTLTHAISSNGKTITGLTEANSTVTVKDSSGKIIGTAKSDNDGKYTVILDKAYLNGENLSISAEDLAGNKSTIQTILADDKTAPIGLTVAIDTAGKFVTGVTEANAVVTIKNTVGTVVGTATADTAGKYSITLDKVYLNGESLSATASDQSGNATAPKTIIAPDTTAPSSLTASIGTAGKVVTGVTEANAVVTVKNAAGIVVGTATADATGKYSVTLDKAYLNGESLSITATDKAGNATAPKIIVAPDITAPSSLTATIDAAGKAITGVTEANATVTVKNVVGTVVGTGTADVTGKYSVTLDKAYLNGESLNVTAVDKAGNATVPKTIIAPDTTAPSNLTATIDAAGEAITGVTEANAVVTVKNAAGIVVGTGTADATGKYSITLDKAYLNGESLNAIAADKVGNTTTPKTIIAPDTTAPSSLIATIDASGKVVAGVTEADARVTVEQVTAVYKEVTVLETQFILSESVQTNYLSKTYSFEVTGTNAHVSLNLSSSTNSLSGSYSSILSGASLNTRLTGNVSQAGEGNYSIDLAQGSVLPPGTYTLTVNYSSSMVPVINVNVTQEVPTTILEVDHYETKVVGTANADEAGNYSITLDKAYLNGENLIATATDQSGNKTEAKEVIVPDITPPILHQPTIQGGWTEGQVVQGTTEANVTVTIKNATGDVIGSAIADASGYYSVILNTVYENGELLKVIATDNKGNENLLQLNAPDTTAPILANLFSYDLSTDKIIFNAPSDSYFVEQKIDGAWVHVNIEEKFDWLNVEYRVTATDQAGNSSQPLTTIINTASGTYKPTDPTFTQIIKGSTGNDYLYGGNGDDTLISNGGSDSLYGGSGNDTLIYGGNSPNIYTGLIGEAGNDTYIVDKALLGSLSYVHILDNTNEQNTLYLKSVSADEIILKQASASYVHILDNTNEQNTLYLKSVSADEIILKQASADRIITFNDSTATIHFGEGQLSSIVFDDGTVWNKAQIEANIIGRLLGTDGDDHLQADANYSVIYGLDGNDTIQGGVQNDYLYGGNGDDTLISNGGSDSLYGGSGNDTLIYGGNSPNVYTGLIGEAGNDTYIVDKALLGSLSYVHILDNTNEQNTLYLKSVSADEIILKQASASYVHILDNTNEQNTLYLKSVSADEIILKQASADRIITFNDSTATIHFGEGLLSSIVFDDGTTWDKAQIEQHIAKTVVGTFDNDVVETATANQTYSYTLDTGADTLIFKVLDDIDNLGGNSNGEWTDFNLSENDKLDLSQLLINNNGNLQEFITVKDTQAGVVMSVDRDGSNQSTYHSQELILLTAKHYTLEDLMASNAFIH